MRVTVEWLNDDQQILYYQFFKDWTWDEAMPQFEKGQKLLSSVDHPVATIAEYMDADEIPKNSDPYIRQIMKSRSTTYKHDTGITVFVNAGALTRAMLDVVALGEKEYRDFAEFLHTKSLEDAIELVEKRLKGF